MADYIDRKDAIVALREFAEKCKGSTEAATAAAMAISVILRLPGPWVSVEDSQPVLHKWIFLRVGIGDVITGWAYVGYATWDSAVDREMAQVRVASHETAVTVTAPVQENAEVTVSVRPKKPSSEASDFLNGLLNGIVVGGVATLLIVWVLMLVFKVV